MKGRTDNALNLVEYYIHSTALVSVSDKGKHLKTNSCNHWITWPVAARIQNTVGVDKEQELEQSIHIKKRSEKHRDPRCGDSNFSTPTKNSVIQCGLCLVRTFLMLYGVKTRQRYLAFDLETSCILELMTPYSCKL